MPTVLNASSFTSKASSFSSWLLPYQLQLVQVDILYVGWIGDQNIQEEEGKKPADCTVRNNNLLHTLNYVF